MSSFRESSIHGQLGGIVNCYGLIKVPYFTPEHLPAELWKGEGQLSCLEFFGGCFELVSFPVLAGEARLFVEQFLEHFAGDGGVIEPGGTVDAKIRFARGIFLEKNADGRRAIAKQRKERFVHQREAQLALDGFAELIGHGQFNFGLGSGSVDFLLRLHGHIELTFHGEAALSHSQFAAVHGRYASGEVREMHVIHIERNVIETRFQRHHAVLDDGIAFKSKQREAALEARVQAQLGRGSDL